MPALVTRGEVDITAVMNLFGTASAQEGSRYDSVIFVIGEKASVADTVLGLKESLSLLERKPPGRILVVVAPEVILDVALAAFAAAKSLARETAMPAHCVNCLWLKSGTLPGWRKPVDLWKEAATLAPTILALESTSGQVFTAGPSHVNIPH